jgi:atlastin
MAEVAINPIQVFAKNELNIDTISAEFKEFLENEVGDRKVCIICVSGSYRTGKSFIANFILRGLYALIEGKESNWMDDEEQPLTGFKWDRQEDGLTKGIFFWPKPFIIKRTNGEEIAILLADTEGLDEYTVSEENEGQETWRKILAFSLMMSSIQIYNCQNSFKSTDFDSLAMFMEYTKAAISASNEKAFQALYLLIRDWEHGDQSRLGFTGGRNYYKEIKECDNFNRIDGSFQLINCCLVSPPSETLEQDPYFNGSINAIKAHECPPGFLESIKEFVEHFFNKEKIIVKKIFGEEMNGIQLLSNLINFDEMIMTVLPKDSNDVIRGIFNGFYLGIISSSLRFYDEKMQMLCGKQDIEELDKFVEEESDLVNLHIRVNNDLLSEFEKKPKVGGEEVYQRNLDVLKKKIESKFNIFKSTNREKLITAKKLNDAIAFSIVLIYTIEFSEWCSTMIQNENEVPSNENTTKKYEELLKKACDTFNTSVNLHGSKKFISSSYQSIFDKMEEVLTLVLARNNEMKDNIAYYTLVKLVYDISMKTFLSNHIVAKREELEENHKKSMDLALSVFDSFRPTSNEFDLNEKFLEVIKQVMNKLYENYIEQNETKKYDIEIFTQALHASSIITYWKEMHLFINMNQNNASLLKVLENKHLEIVKRIIEELKKNDIYKLSVWTEYEAKIRTNLNRCFTLYLNKSSGIVSEQEEEYDMISVIIKNEDINALSFYFDLKIDNF